MTRRGAYALLAAFAVVAVLASVAIYTGFVGGLGRGPEAGQGSGQRAKPRNSAAPASAATWVGTWATSPAGAEPNTPDGYPGQSIRNVVHTSIGGKSVRITVSNLYGQFPLTITHASVAVAAQPSSPEAAAGTMRRLAFDGQTSVVIAPGDEVVSDAVRLAVPQDADLLVTTYTNVSGGGPVTYHPHARQISYLAQGDHTEDLTGESYGGQTPYWRYLTAVDVLSTDTRGAVVFLGDSLTDGITSTVGANRRWPDVLADRLVTEQGGLRYGILNEGISGNRVLLSGSGRPSANQSGLLRLDRDVLSRTGVRTVVVALGVNDILRTRQTDPDVIVGGLKELTARAHAQGLHVVGATLMPFGGHRTTTPALNAVRLQVNERIRAGGIFDEVVDFDRALRDPAVPDRLLPRYDSGDHLHPSDDGYAAMANAFDLGHLEASAPTEL